MWIHKRDLSSKVATILVIDDEESILNIVDAYLKADGNTVYAARDGAAGLAAFQRYKPDLVILDIMLPEMDGLEVLRTIRRSSEVYVILLTARSEEFDRVMGLTVGADDYLTKPFSPRELAARVPAGAGNRRTTNHRTARAATGGRSLTARADQPDLFSVPRVAAARAT